MIIPEKRKDYAGKTLKLYQKSAGIIMEKNYGNAGKVIKMIIPGKNYENAGKEIKL